MKRADATDATQKSGTADPWLLLVLGLGVLESWREILSMLGLVCLSGLMDPRRTSASSTALGDAKTPTRVRLERIQCPTRSGRLI